MHLNPDHFLHTAEGRVISHGMNEAAWRRCFALLPQALVRARDEGGLLYVLVGCQGSGKSTWARHQAQHEPASVIFDAILVKRSERAELLAQAARHGVPAVAVWFRTPLDVCLARNAARPSDEVASEQGLRNVFAALEPPTHDEGFLRVIQVGAQHPPARGLVE